MIKIYHKSIKEKKIRSINSFRAGSWVKVENPDDRDLNNISVMLDLDKDLLFDALDPYEAPRLESKDNIIYLFTRVPQRVNNKLKICTFLIAFGNDFILTLSKDKIDFLNKLLNQRQINTTQKTKFFLKLFSLINHQYNVILLDINKKAQTLRARIKKINNTDIVRFIDLEKIINDILSVLAPTNNILKILLSGKYISLYKEDKDLTEDLFLANTQLLDYAKMVLKYIINIRNAYSNIMTHDLNRIMKFLTALTIILTIPTMIYSFYGMNIALPLASSPFAVIYVNVFTFLVLLAIFILFLKNRWL